MGPSVPAELGTANHLLLMPHRRSVRLQLLRSGRDLVFDDRSISVKRPGT